MQTPAAVVGSSFFSVTVTAQDTYGNTVTGYTSAVHFTSSDGSATLPGNYTFVTADDGVHVFTGDVKLVSGPTETVTATDTLTSTIKGSGVASVAGPANQFVVTDSGSTISGTPFTITVTAEDSSNNIAGAYQGTVHFSTNDTSNGVMVPADYAFTTADDGVHVFTNSTTLVTSDYQTVTATDSVSSTITGNSAVFVPVTMWMSTNLMASPGGTVTVPINVNGLLDTTNGNYGLSDAQFVIQYDPNVFTGSPTLALGSIPESSGGWSVSTWAGPVIVLSSSSLQISGTAGGSLIQLNFTVKTNATLADEHRFLGGHPWRTTR